MLQQKTYRQLLILLCFSLVLMSLSSLFIGRYSLSVQDVVHILLGAPHSERSREKAAVIFDLRLPRIIAAGMVGAGLSVAGATYQAVLKNALASPDVLGTSSASAFGAALGIVMGLSYQVSTGCAFVFGMLSLALVFGLCFLRQSHEAIVTILSGLIVASVFVAFVSVLKYLADPEDTLPAIVFWLMGSFSSLVKTEVFSLIPLFMFCYYVIYRLRWTMNILSLGDDEAKIQGLHPLLLKIILLVSASVMISASVVLCGGGMGGARDPPSCQSPHRKQPRKINPRYGVMWCALLACYRHACPRAHFCGNSRRYSVRPDRGTVICIFVCQRSHP